MDAGIYSKDIKKTEKKRVEAKTIWLTVIYKPSHTQAVKLLIKEFYTLIEWTRQ